MSASGQLTAWLKEKAHAGIVDATGIKTVRDSLTTAEKTQLTNSKDNANALNSTSLNPELYTLIHHAPSNYPPAHVNRGNVS